MGTRLGKARIALWLRRFGFGTPTGIDLPGEAAGLIHPVREWYDPMLQTISFGQGISVTPLQLLVAAGAIANGGVVVHSHIGRVARRLDGRSEVLAAPAGRRVMTPETARAVTEMMKRVVTEGTGTRAAVEGYAVAGQTGMAQKPEPTGGYAPDRFVASFVSFAPAAGPRVVMLVLIDEPRGRYYGGEVAAPCSLGSPCRKRSRPGSCTGERQEIG